LKHLNILKNHKNVFINKNNAMGMTVTNDTLFSLKDLSGPLSSLLYKNQRILKKAFQKHVAFSKCYQTMMFTLKKCIKITKNFSSPFDSSSQEIALPALLTPITNSTPSHKYHMPLFILKPAIETTGSYYHILYSVRTHPSLEKLIQLSKKNLNKFKIEVTNLLSKINDIPIFKVPYIKRNKKYLLKTNTEILSSLYTGLKETQLYLKKYHPTEFATHFCNNPFSDIHETLLLIEKGFFSPQDIPVVNQPHTLEAVLQKAIAKKAQCLIKNSFPITCPHEQTLFLKKQNIFIFSIKNIRSNVSSNCYTYKFGYLNKKQKTIKKSWPLTVQELLKLGIDHMHALCAKDFTILNIEFENPLTMESKKITNAIAFYKLMYEGIQENLAILTKTLSITLKKTTSYDIKQEYQNLLDTLAFLLGDHISEVKAPYILDYITQNKQKQ
ncbi:hypothetical protein CLAVI_000930, partial [Candidatus Clavichlamydia salmonicola]|uniref:hypothetical protein n=1 Tax=Candidatus Clavichlamydia salmonicola TaxID=469812 RepID=UPI001E4AE6E5